MTRTPSRHTAALALAAASFATPVAQAHSYVIMLGEPAGSTHYVGLICSTDGGYETDHLYMQLQVHTVGGPLVSAQVVKGNVATNVTDPVNGDALPSPASRTRGGNGQYQVLINKSGPGAVTFGITVHCLDASGTIHTGTDVQVYQFQDR
jgi:hypothetical protein